MNTVRAHAFGILLACAALVAACERSPRTPPPAPRAEGAGSASLEAADPVCLLPLERFASSRMELVGSYLGYPVTRLVVQRSGELLWNNERVGPRLLDEYLRTEATVSPPVFLVVTPARDAPCAVVRDALSAALREGRCSRDRCAFEWPGTNAPPAAPSASSPLPARNLLLGNWILASIDRAPPPPGAPPVEVIFTDGAVGARSQCITYNWLVAVEEGRLGLKAPPGPVAMCARAWSPWEERFGEVMSSATRIESDGSEAVVVGARGRLTLRRPPQTQR